MTVVHVALKVPALDGSLVPAKGSLQFTPTARRKVGGVTVLPSSFQAALLDGVVDVELAPTEPGWAWRIDEYITGITGRTIYAAIPATGPVNYGDLDPLDPATLTPAATLDPAWAPFTVHPDATNPGFYLIGNS